MGIHDPHRTTPPRTNPFFAIDDSPKRAARGGTRQAAERDHAIYLRRADRGDALIQPTIATHGFWQRFRHASLAHLRNRRSAPHTQFRSGGAGELGGHGMGSDDSFYSTVRCPTPFRHKPLAGWNGVGFDWVRGPPAISPLSPPSPTSPTRSDFTRPAGQGPPQRAPAGRTPSCPIWSGAILRRVVVPRQSVHEDTPPRLTGQSAVIQDTRSPLPVHETRPAGIGQGREGAGTLPPALCLSESRGVGGYQRRLQTARAKHWPSLDLRRPGTPVRLLWGYPHYGMTWHAMALYGALKMD